MADPSPTHRPPAPPADAARAAPSRTVRRRLTRRSPVVMLCLGVLCSMALIAIFADVLAPMHYAEQNLSARLRPPSFLGGPENNLLGTEPARARHPEPAHPLDPHQHFAGPAGHDHRLLSGHGPRVRGGIPARGGRGLHHDAGRFPGVRAVLIIALSALAFFGNSLVLFILLIGIHGWETYARLSRGLVLSAKERGYVVAVRTLGAGPAPGIRAARAAERRQRPGRAAHAEFSRNDSPGNRIELFRAGSSSRRSPVWASCWAAQGIISP